MHLHSSPYCKQLLQAIEFPLLQILPIVLPPLNRQLGGEPMVLAGIVERNIRGNFNISQGFMMGFQGSIYILLHGFNLINIGNLTANEYNPNQTTKSFAKHWHLI